MIFPFSVKPTADFTLNYAMVDCPMAHQMDGMLCMGLDE